MAEAVVDLIDDAVAPLMTREEATDRFEAMLAHFDVRWDQERAERARERAEDRAERVRERAEDQAERVRERAEFAKFASRVESRFGGMDQRFGEMDRRLGTLEGSFATLERRFGDLEGCFGELRGSVEKLRGDLIWRMFLVFCAFLAGIAAVDRLLG